MRADEKWSCLMEGDSSFAHQRLQRFGKIVRDRHDPFLAALAAQEHLWSRTIQLKVAGIDADGLRNARAGARQEQQQRPVAPAARRLLIRGVDDASTSCRER